MRLKNLYIKDYKILHDFSIDFTSNLSVLIGENGSGKTTLMNMISGIYYPDEGHIFINGEEVVITEEFDNSDFCVAGDVTDHRDGTVTVKLANGTTFVLIKGASVIYESLAEVHVSGHAYQEELKTMLNVSHEEGVLEIEERQIINEAYAGDIIGVFESYNFLTTASISGCASSIASSLS
mgnify:CR=1 FL=1